MKENKTKTKIALGVVAGAVCAAIVCAVTFPLFNVQKQVEETPKKDYVVIMPDTSNGVELMSTTIDPVDFEEYGVSAQAESAKELTAVMTPAGTYTEFDWAIVWSTPDTGFASGKTVTDYMTIVPTSDGANTAVLSCLQSYGTQIIVTATSRTNSALTVSATVDYDLNFKGIGFELIFDGTAKSKLGVSNMSYTGYDSTEITMPAPNVVGNVGNFTYRITGNTGIYSGIKDEVSGGTDYFSAGLYAKPSTAFAEQLTAQGLTLIGDYVSIDPALRGTTNIINGTIYSVEDYSISFIQKKNGVIPAQTKYVTAAGIYGALCYEVLTYYSSSGAGTLTSSLVQFLEAAKNTSGYHFDLKAVIYPYMDGDSVDLTRPVETVYKVTFSSETLTVVEPSSVAMDNAALVF